MQVDSPSEIQSLVTLGLADRMLAEVATVDEARALINLAEQARVYARQSKLGTSAINHATVIKVRAERRLADIVDEGQARGEIATSHDGSPAVRSADTYDELGLTRQGVDDARTLRDGYSEEQLEELRQAADSEDEVLSRKELIRKARDATRVNEVNAQEQEERVKVLFPIYDALAALASCSLTPSEFKQRVLPASTYRVTGNLTKASDWLQELRSIWE